jgi:hypothetical protein
MLEQIKIRVKPSYYYNGTSYYYSPNNILVKPEQVCTSARTKNKGSVRTKGQSKLLLHRERERVIIIDRTIIIAKTTYYYGQNKFVCHLEQTK